MGTVAFQPPCTTTDGRVPSGFKLDIWAAGICLYYMVVGKYPFVAETLIGLIAIIGKCEYELPETLSDELSDLIQRILIKDENTRYTIPEIVRHQYLYYLFVLFFLFIYVYECVKRDFDISCTIAVDGFRWTFKKMSNHSLP